MKLSSQILAFITKNSSTEIIQNPSNFPRTPYEYLYLPEKKIIIHCIEYTISVDNFNFFYQLSEYFFQQNLKIIHLWSDIYQTKQSIVEARLLTFLNKNETLPARLTFIKRIDKKTTNIFLEQNHLQSSTNAKLKYGLFLPKKYIRVLKFNNKNSFFNTTQKANFEQSNEILVAVATFSNAKTIIRNSEAYRSYELIRFVTLKGLTVVGGLNKLIKNFIKEQNPDDIMTYADADWSDGRNYEKLGFERIEHTLPIIFELNENTLVRQNLNQKSSLKPIANAGNWKFLMKLKHEYKRK